jgi:hypothetical protein
LLDAPLRAMADPALPENPAKSPWYFLGVQELVSYSAFSGGIAIPLLLITGLFLMPVFDREQRAPGIWFSGKDGIRIAVISMLFAFPAAAGVIFIAPFTAALTKGHPLYTIFFNPGIILMLLYIIWSLLIGRIYRSTRLSAIALFTVSVAGFIVFTVTGIWLRGMDWQFIWPWNV